jgi:hypothetical protein
MVAHRRPRAIGIAPDNRSEDSAVLTRDLLGIYPPALRRRRAAVLQTKVEGNDAPQRLEKTRKMSSCAATSDIAGEGTTTAATVVATPSSERPPA